MKGLRRPATEAEVAIIRDARERRMAWHDIGPLVGASRTWVRSVAIEHGLSTPLPSPIPANPKPPLTLRELTGLAPLRAGHPLALAELERARGIEL